jgi:hypothetical protein
MTAVNQYDAVLVFVKSEEKWGFQDNGRAVDTV